MRQVMRMVKLRISEMSFILDTQIILSFHAILDA